MFPRVPLTLLVTGLLGLFLGCVAAVIGESFRARVDTADAIEDLLGVPCYAEVPLETVVPQVDLLGSLGSDPRLRGMHEALRDVRTNLQLEDGLFRSIVITSPDGHHGKTTIAAGLATTLAQSGRRTLLIDGDLRRGRLAEVTGLGPGPGLMDALTGAPVSELTRATEVEGLNVLTRGDVAADPGDLLRAYPSVLRQVRETYDVAVIDTTPLLPINDARVLAGFSDVILLVVSAESALKRRLQAAVDRLTVLSLRPTAFILNRSRERVASDYYVTIPERAEPRPAPGAEPARRCSVTGASSLPDRSRRLPGGRLSSPRRPRWRSRSRSSTGRSGLPCSRSASSSVSPPSLSAFFGSTWRCWCSWPRSRWRPPSHPSPRC